jgi:hypothetical protein
MCQVSSGLIAVITAVTGVVGVIIGALLDYKLSEGREKKRAQARDQRERATAYVALKNALTKIRSGPHGARKPAIIDIADYDQLAQIIAQHFQVLDESTKKVWETAKGTLAVNRGINANLRDFDLDDLEKDVTKKYSDLPGVK